MMLKTQLGLCAALLFLVYPSPAQPRLKAPLSAIQGQLLVFSLESTEGLGEVRLSVESRPDAETERLSLGFERALTDGTKARFFLYPLPYNAPVGPMAFTFSGSQGPSGYRLRHELTVAKANFPYMEIRLNSDLTTIKASPNPRRDRESAVLSALILSSNPDSDWLCASFQRPLHEIAVSSCFGDTRRYLHSDGTDSRSVHWGLDLYAEAGTQVRSCARGVVRMATERVLTGNTVVIEHLSGLYSLYYHLSSIEVRVGQLVDGGNLVGRVGSTGLSTGPHLHWELRYMGIALNPESLCAQASLDRIMAQSLEPQVSKHGISSNFNQ